MLRSHHVAVDSSIVVTFGGAVALAGKEIWPATAKSMSKDSHALTKNFDTWITMPTPEGAPLTSCLPEKMNHTFISLSV
jgi:hypothetical protein